MATISTVQVVQIDALLFFAGQIFACYLLHAHSFDGLC